MLSKLTKIFATGAVLGALAFSSSSFADGMEPCHKPKKHCAPVCAAPCEAPCSPCAAPCEAPCADPCAPKCGLMNGMILGVYGDWGYGNHENKDFVIPKIETPKFEGPSIFNSKRDNAFGGGISWGYMMNSGLEGNISLDYHQIKNKAPNRVNNVTSHIESDIFSAMINGVYYVDFNSMILPYLSLGAGIARTKANGTIYDTPEKPADAGKETYLTFNNLKSIRLAYQASAGIATMIDQIMIGVGYKFFGVSSIDDGDSFTDATASISEGGKPPVALTTPFKFGSLRNNVHNVTVFAKFVV